MSRLPTYPGHGNPFTFIVEAAQAHRQSNSRERQPFRMTAEIRAADAEVDAQEETRLAMMRARYGRAKRV